MNGIYYYLIAFIVIWILAFGLKNKLTNHGFEIQFPLIMWRTEKFKNFIKRMANLSPKFWKWFMNIGIVISYIAMIYITWTLVSSLSSMLETPSVSLVIPGVEMPGSSIYVPLGYGLIALATVLIVHEFSHGILAIVEKINVKSVGLMLFAILPGAFMEPDEEEMKEANKSSKLRIYAAGSMANITLAVMALLIVSAVGSYVIPSTFEEDGIEVDRLVGDSPASKVLKEGMIIESIDNHKVHDSNSYVNAVNNLKPGQNITIGTNEGDYSIILDKNPNNESKGYMGIQAAKHYELNDGVASIYGDTLPWIWFGVLELFQWICILNLGIGLFNLLPLKPLDGGHMFETLLSYKLPKYFYKPIVNSLSLILGMIIIFSIVYGFL
ncbi:site-2 protease family protein [Methanobrevibacter smithii]|jgi:predicted membrane-associated Zn-dependent protease|uniref:site-2 protease family protein n=1 Tax=Methanobrevibacter smithii TaxID=2173 RepID=UPI0037DCC433